VISEHTGAHMSQLAVPVHVPTPGSKINFPGSHHDTTDYKSDCENAAPHILRQILLCSDEVAPELI
jgi:hypothetical protein